MPGFAELAVILFAFGLNVALIGAIVSAAGFDRSTWAFIGRDKSRWIIAMLLAGVFAAPIYLFFVRPKLKRALLEEPIAGSGQGESGAISEQPPSAV